VCGGGGGGAGSGLGTGNGSAGGAVQIAALVRDGDLEHATRKYRLLK
jgi:hypothetical protein